VRVLNFAVSLKEEIGGTPDFFEPGMLNSWGLDEPESRDLLDRGADDPHQFRIIMAPEDGARLGDLKRCARELVEEIVRDL
jgi:type IV secretory pathway VirD2 relaxase